MNVAQEIMGDPQIAEDVAAEVEAAVKTAKAIGESEMQNLRCSRLKLGLRQMYSNPNPLS